MSWQNSASKDQCVPRLCSHCRWGSVKMPVLGVLRCTKRGRASRTRDRNHLRKTCYNILRSPLIQPILGELSLNVKNWGRRKGEKWNTVPSLSSWWEMQGCKPPTCSECRDQRQEPCTVWPGTASRSSPQISEKTDTSKEHKARDLKGSYIGEQNRGCGTGWKKGIAC